MNWRTCLAHSTITGHTHFYNDSRLPDSTSWVCLDCPSPSPPLCQFPGCPLPASPFSPFCPSHTPLSHLGLGPSAQRPPRKE